MRPPRTAVHLPASPRRGRARCAARPARRTKVAAFLDVWDAWLRRTDRSGWAKLAKKKGKLSVFACAAGLLLFDAMCFDALQGMHCAHDRAGGSVAAHLAFHAQLPFTSEARCALAMMMMMMVMMTMTSNMTPMMPMISPPAM